MNGKRIAAGLSLLFAFSGACLAASGTIRFQGSIVEPGCQSRVGTDGTFDLYQCSAQSRAMGVEANTLAPTASVSAVGQSRTHVKLLADSGQEGRYFDQQYVLVDDAGSPVRSGNYLITLSMP
ncbi:type 1 fimbrial protein [Pseudomonas sp. GL-RE-26]|uniref:type 1 fimbrial protein n=1 Tax=Pseudomonas sp. GL-RE-26 TaxID=2832390 RepID=UPI001CBB41A8|nr:type 1 fimbrial protein [Pseudomonas sp. GL-RE-26]